VEMWKRGIGETMLYSNDGEGEERVASVSGDQSVKVQSRGRMLH
jgi:hypothetical protein